LEGALASIACTVKHMVDGGDHWIVIGEVIELQLGPGPHEPLLFYRGRYRQLGGAAGAAAPDLSAVTEEPAHVHFAAGTDANDSPDAGPREATGPVRPVRKPG
jgi:flavin reductase (DIM6/NTAB) family NADH-FMN oxidoreductase RutF